MDETTTTGIVGTVAVLAGLVVLALFWRAREKRKIIIKTRDEIARIEEITLATAGGTLAMLLLVLHNAGMLAIFMGTKNAIQEASLGTLWIAGNVLWGIGVIVGRKRTYVVTRDIQPRPSDPPLN